jgi:hypothetical protein
MRKKFSRREALGLGVVAGSAAIIGACSDKKKEIQAVYPWKYKPLNVRETKERAYKNYFKGGCMYAVFEAIAGQVAAFLGKPYTGFPFEMSTYGGAGVVGWGTLCGTCNGAAMAVAMFHKGSMSAQLTNEVFTWYEDTNLPVFVPAEPAEEKKDMEIKPSQAHSTICHISITRWTEESGKDSFSPERTERCARLVADVAGYTARLLNEAAENKFTPKNQIGAVTGGCLACHARGKQAPHEPEVAGKMYCPTCHSNAHHQ